MKIFVNTDKKTYPEGTTLSEIIKNNSKYNKHSYNVILNGTLVKKDAYEKTVIKNNDKIKILPFAMGG